MESEGANNAITGQPLSNGRPLNSQGESIRIQKPVTNGESRQGAISVHSSINSQKSNTSSQRQVIVLTTPYRERTPDSEFSHEHGSLPMRGDRHPQSRRDKLYSEILSRKRQMRSLPKLAHG